MNINRARITIRDFFIINIPAFLFLFLIPLGLLLRKIFYVNNVLRFLYIPFFIWGVSGCSLLLADYFKRKKKLYIRLLTLNENRDPLKHSIYLKSTVCGLAILWALRVRKNYNRS